MTARIFKISLISLLLLPVFIAGCGSQEKAKDTSTATTYTFTTDINPIVKASCAGNTTCHGTGETGGDGLGYVYEDNQTAFVRDSSLISTYIQKSQTDSTAMPKPGYGISITDANKQKILDYLNQTTKN